jgi:hypothetical protein
VQPGDYVALAWGSAAGSSFIRSSQ